MWYIQHYITYVSEHLTFFTLVRFLFAHSQRLVSQFNIISTSIKQKCFQSPVRLRAPKNTVLNLTRQTLSDASPPLPRPSNLSVAKWKAHFCVIHLLFHSCRIYYFPPSRAADATELDSWAHGLLVTSQPALTGKIYLKTHKCKQRNPSPSYPKHFGGVFFFFFLLLLMTVQLYGLVFVSLFKISIDTLTDWIGRDVYWLNVTSFIYTCHLHRAV